VPALKLRKDAEKLMNAEIKFWKSVTEFAAPCGEEFIAAAQAYITQMDVLELVEANVKEAREVLINIYGKSRVKLEGGGVSVLRTPRKGSLDQDKLVADFIKDKKPEEVDALIKKAIDYDKVIEEVSKGKTKDQLEAYIDKFRDEGTEPIVIKVTKQAKDATASAKSAKKEAVS